MGSTLLERLIVGAKVKIGAEYAAMNPDYSEGDVIELVEGFFERINGFNNEIDTAPSVWNDRLKEYDSIYHLFGNRLENFRDCVVLTT
jgi:hypothetical protein